MTKNKFFNIIMENLSDDDYSKNVLLSIKSKQDLNVSFTSPIIELLIDKTERTMLISNAYGYLDYPTMTVQSFIDVLGSGYNLSYPIVFEIYDYSEKISKIIASVYDATESDITVLKSDDNFIIEVITDKIKK